MPVDVDEFYRRYGPMVLRRCRKLLREEEQAVDAMHDTFVQLLRHQDGLTGSAPSGLLFRMATNVCLNRIRSVKRKPESRDEELLQRIAAVEDSEARLVARFHLHKLFAQEQSSTREIAVMHLLDGMTLEEIALEVGLSVSGVRKRLRKLRARLAELDGFGS